MNVLLLGKTGGITHWVEDVAEDLRLSDHVVTIIPTRNPWLGKPIENALLSPGIGAPLAAHIVRKVRRLRPELILAIGALDQFPIVMFEHLAAMRDRPPLIAWIGDVFEPRHAALADLFDIIAYTDTGLLRLHQDFNFQSSGAFVPLGATRSKIGDPAARREPRLAFVAAPTRNRRALLADIHAPVAIFGPGWQEGSELDHHRRDARRIHPDELARIYAGHLGVLNIRHGLHVINGLNQRHFAPYVQGAPVITDAQPDIPHCFDPGSEMLVYQDADELNALYEQLRTDPARATAVGSAGQRRVLAHHAYTNRLDAIAALAGIKSPQTRR